MADFLKPKRAANGIDNIVRRWPGRFIDKYCAVKWIKGKHVLLCGLKSFSQRSDQPALHGKRLPDDARTRCRYMAAATKLRSNCVDINLCAL